jgi:Secretion system C-terminal sorting domain
MLIFEGGCCFKPLLYVFNCKIMKKLYLLLTASFIFVNIHAQLRQITRGHFPGEIYISSIWYEPEYGVERYDAVFYSGDNGQSIGIRFSNNPYTSEMPIGDLCTDAKAGVIYNSYQKNFWISTSSGYSWENRFPHGNTTNTYATGCTEDEVYMLWVNQNPLGSLLERSNDYGINFNVVNNDPRGGNIEVGTEENEIYIMDSPSNNDSLKIYFSSNAGADFYKQCQLDPEIGGTYFVKYPAISRGTSAGELYLVSWHTPANFRIYRSTDYGKTFDLRYISETVETYYRYCFTAGVVPGSFYVQYSIPWIGTTGATEMHILHSSDTAKTFTEYVHFLDENFPVSIPQAPLIDNPFFMQLVVTPNPAKVQFMLQFSLKDEAVIQISIYDVNGRLLYKTTNNSCLKGENNIQINCSDFPRGIYNCMLITTNKKFIAKKIVIL